MSARLQLRSLPQHEIGEKDDTEYSWPLHGKTCSSSSRTKALWPSTFSCRCCSPACWAWPLATQATTRTTIEIAILLVNQDSGSYGQMLADGLRRLRCSSSKSWTDAAQADQMVANGDAAAAIVIPADLSDKIDAGEPVEVTVIKDPTQPEAARHCRRHHQPGHGRDRRAG